MSLNKEICAKTLTQICPNLGKTKPWKNEKQNIQKNSRLKKLVSKPAPVFCSAHFSKFNFKSFWVKIESNLGSFVRRRRSLWNIKKKSKLGQFSRTKPFFIRAEQSLLLPEVCGSNPVIGEFLLISLFTVNCIEKTKIKKKEAGNGHFS